MKKLGALKFKIVARGFSSPTAKGLPRIFLETDDWNDYSYRTLYHLYYFHANEGLVEKTLIGPVKILKKGQATGNAAVIIEDFLALDENFCSVGQTLDYYERLNGLPEQIKIFITEGLRDVVSNPTLVSKFNKEPAWKSSLFRDQPDGGSGFRKIARSLITGDYSKMPREKLDFSFSLPNWFDVITFNFGRDRTGRSSLPDRLAVVVGRNGSGKSTLLARLARVAHATSTVRSTPEYQSLGILEPSGLGFPRIITVSFSPFDSFRLPGADEGDREQVAKDLSKNEGRFSFIGLRDLSAEARANLSSDEGDNLTTDKIYNTALKSIAQLADDFVDHLVKISLKSRTCEFHERISEIFSSSELEGFGFSATNISIEIAKEEFLRRSTGHKIVLLAVAGILANIERHSLILMDEPETHLHPPMLASLMHAVLELLDSHQAFGIVATHSPVVVQESLAENVTIVRRESGFNGATQPSVETYGESIGTITAEVFGLQADATDFHTVLDKLIRRYKNVDKIENLFLNQSMSRQAYAYVLAKLSQMESDTDA